MAFNGALTKWKEYKSLESCGDHKIKMASICCECGFAHEITLKTPRNFHFRTKNSLKRMIIESRQRNEEKGSPIELHIEFYC